jgi:hypothetical protein
MSASPPPAEPAKATEPGPLERALECLSKGDNRCVIAALEGSSGPRELALLSETYRATSDSAAADRSMARYLQLHPAGPRASQYRRALGLSEASEAP